MRALGGSPDGAEKIAAAPPQTDSAGGASVGLVAWLVGAAMAIGISLGVLYGLIRFVKWAWSD